MTFFSANNFTPKTLTNTCYLFSISLCMLTLNACQPLATTVQNIGTKIGAPINQSIENSQSNDEQKTANNTVGDVHKLLIEANRVACDSPKPMQCMIAQVAPLKGEQQPVYIQLPYDAIKGFQSYSNTKYIINARPLINSQTGTPTGYWKLENILSQRPVNRIE